MDHILPLHHRKDALSALLIGVYTEFWSVNPHRSDKSDGKHEQLLSKNRHLTTNLVLTVSAPHVG
jgi:hypothetical protein